MKNKKLKQEYEKMYKNTAPDLWNRIEANLEPEPVRTFPPREAAAPPRTHRWPYGLAAASAAAVVSLAVLTARVSSPLSTGKQFSQETIMLAEEAAAASEAAPVPAAAAEAMSVAAYTPLAVPPDAVSVPADSRYFSEAILADTELLCQVTILNVTIADGPAGRPEKVVYEASVNQVLYARDYVTEQTLALSSPVIAADADEMYLLYQMQPGQTYLLPLRKEQGSWELLYPFAPQIQQLDGQRYLFHSGFSSLVNERTSVSTLCSRQGTNDFYYDRMLVRADEDFLADLLALVKQNVRQDN